MDDIVEIERLREEVRRLLAAALKSDVNHAAEIVRLAGVVSASEKRNVSAPLAGLGLGSANKSGGVPGSGTPSVPANSTWSAKASPIECRQKRPRLMRSAITHGCFDPFASPRRYRSPARRNDHFHQR